MTSLGKYELHEQLGRGGFGTVYRAVDAALQREVALKVLHPQLTTDPDFLERFQNEARLTASLDNPHIVPIYELAEADGRVFIAMKYLPGGSLKQRLEKEGAIPFDETLKIITEVCSGLEAAHRKGLVHRDVKPANILFDGEGKAVIGDFGLARAVQLSSATAASSAAGGAGTPAYRAPELWRGKPPASPATDVYSLGCVLSEMLTGRVLFLGDTPDEILARHLIDGPDIPECFLDGTPVGVRAVLEKAVAKEPLERYKSVTEFEKALEGCGQERAEEERKEPEKSVGKKPAPQKNEGPGVAERNKTSESWPHKKVGILVGVIAALGLGIWLGGLPGNGPAEPTPEPTAVPTLGIGSTLISEIDGMEMVYVPAGEFLMGASADQEYELCKNYQILNCDRTWFENDEPQHTVNLDAYWIDKTEVTNRMYAQCVAAGDCSEPQNESSYSQNSYYGNSQFSDYPVIHVSWYQAEKYCAWAGRSLPTEAQWEKAARGTDGRIYPWGNVEPDRDFVNYTGNEDDTTAVGSYKAGVSPYGVLDMAGNVWEWVADWYVMDYYKNSPSKNPAGPSFGEYRGHRGGAWNSLMFHIRSTIRGGGDPSYAEFNLGFRCALSRP